MKKYSILLIVILLLAIIFKLFFIHIYYGVSGEQLPEVLKEKEKSLPICLGKSFILNKEEVSVDGIPKIICIGFLKLKEENNEILSDSFTIEMYGNYTSSGASRVYKGELTFVNNEVVNGSQSYSVGEGSICKENCNRITECIVKDQQWVDKINREKCGIDTFSSPLTKEGLIQQINEGKILPSEDIYQCHYSTCYKIRK